MRRITAEELCPYPGKFLKANIEKEAREALYGRPESLSDRVNFLSTDEILEIAIEKGKTAGEYFEFAKQWPNLIKNVQKNREILRYFDTKFKK